MIWVDISLDQLADKLEYFSKEAPNAVRDGVQDFLDEESGMFHPNEMVYDITSTTSSALVKGKTNRLWTYRMGTTGEGRIDDVSEGVFNFRFGWFQAPLYINWQETGIHPTGKEKPIEPMNALQQMATEYIESKNGASPTGYIRSSEKRLWKRS